MHYPFTKDIHHCWLVSTFTLNKTETILKNTLPTVSTIQAEARYLKKTRAQPRAATATARLPAVRQADTRRPSVTSSRATSPHLLLRAPSRAGASSVQA